MESAGAYRTYYLWESKFEGKYIMIAKFVPKGSSTFATDVKWVADGFLHKKGNRAAYSKIANRPRSVIESLSGPLPDCIILAQDVRIHPKEAQFRMLIVPDKFCSGAWEPVMEELDRVAIQPE